MATKLSDSQRRVLGAAQFQPLHLGFAPLTDMRTIDALLRRGWIELGHVLCNVHITPAGLAALKDGAK